MGATTTITLALGGYVNGAPVDLSGRAELDLSAGRLELELASRATPLHWDPVLGLLGLLDAVKLMAVVEVRGTGPLQRTFLRRREELTDEHGRELGHGVLSMALSGTSCRAQVPRGQRAHGGGGTGDACREHHDDHRAPCWQGLAAPH